MAKQTERWLFGRTLFQIECDLFHRGLETFGATYESLLEDGLGVWADLFAAGNHQLLLHEMNLPFNRGIELRGNFEESFDIVLETPSHRDEGNLGNLVQEVGTVVC